MWRMNLYGNQRGYSSAWPHNSVWHDMRRWQRNMDYRLGGTNGPIRATFPRTNVYISDESAVFTAEVPGFDSEEIEISVLNKTLTLSGNHKSEEPGETSRIRRQERINRDFSRSFELPFRVDVDAIQAKIINGVLNVELPRLPEEKPKKITVNAT